MIEVSGILLLNALFAFIHSFVIREICETLGGSVWSTFRECKISLVLEYHPTT